MKEVVRKVVNWWNGCSEEEALKAKAEYEAAAKRLPNETKQEKNDAPSIPGKK